MLSTLIIIYSFLKVETFVNKTIHYPNWDMSQSQIPFNFFRKNQSQTQKKKKKHNLITFKKKAKKKKEKEKKEKNFARCIGIPM